MYLYQLIVNELMHSENIHASDGLVLSSCVENVTSVWTTVMAFLLPIICGLYVYNSFNYNR